MSSVEIIVRWDKVEGTTVIPVKQVPAMAYNTYRRTLSRDEREQMVVTLTGRAEALIRDVVEVTADE